MAVSGSFATVRGAATDPAPLRRADSFLGIHFDFHATEEDRNIGATVTEEMVQQVVDRVRPDYIQVDCKGHRGHSSYPTKVGNPAPGIVKDALRVWRDVTARNDVALYVHYSGVFDQAAIGQHPDWAVTTASGDRDENYTSVFGPYVDELLIPQLKELRRGYGVDGVWLDGECWGAQFDYSPAALATFAETTGMDTVPREPGDPGYRAFAEVMREGFREYLRHYLQVLHEFDPDFQIASNWAFSSIMPEPVTADVDFLSGDFTPTDSFNSARWEGRVLQQQGLPWDLMAWGFRHSEEEPFASRKSPLQLKQEAAVVLSLGGGVQAYFPQRRDGSVRLEDVNAWADAAAFCRARQPFCHRAQPVPQVGMIFNTAWLLRRGAEMGRLYGPYGPLGKGLYVAPKGALQVLLDNQQSVEVLMEAHLEDRLGAYPLLVLPECDYLDPHFRHQLLRYVDQGGRLLLMGPRAARLFAAELGYETAPEVEQQRLWLAEDGLLGGMSTAVMPAASAAGAQLVGQLYDNPHAEGTPRPAALRRPRGQGELAALMFDVAPSYLDNRNVEMTRFVGDLVRALFPDPMVKVVGSGQVDVCVNRLQGKLMINLVNSSGPHDNPQVASFDDLAPVGPLTLQIRTERPRAVTLQPQGRSIPFRYQQDTVALTVEQVPIHQVVVVE